jgi:hypothetical protein
VNRRAFTALLAAGITPARAAEDRRALHARDITFLLDELPKHTGRFLELKKIDWNAVRAEFETAAPADATDGDHLVRCGRLLARLRAMPGSSPGALARRRPQSPSH